jgi:hypothetical protein
MCTNMLNISVECDSARLGNCLHVRNGLAVAPC